ncbi:hypothetical protein PoB_000235300 [Plakobranchus ocellatus]|uniref:Uncharacterized protein n=1 Tax=Plakobranchus ocellatus TaxID=259542 RepID=A0AAV3Y0Q7_9GAST|nr:hypothetical protein PoB_000235300 [Plakobranchus ocellatus]
MVSLTKEMILEQLFLYSIENRLSRIDGTAESVARHEDLRFGAPPSRNSALILSLVRLDVSVLSSALKKTRSLDITSYTLIGKKEPLGGEHSNTEMEKYAVSSFTYENGNYSVGQEESPKVVTVTKTAQKPKKTETWRQALYDFTQNTTLHGVRFIFMDNVSVLRR